MNLEIVVHCWKYHQELAYQLSSLVLYPITEFKLTMTVWYCPFDKPTSDMLDQFQKVMGMRALFLNRRPTIEKELFNRSVGRNASAKKTRADFIWFTDADFVFGRGCLDGLMRWEPEIEDDRVYYPKKTIDQTALSNKYIDRVKKPGIYEIDPKDFQVVRRYRKACGGLQIVTGNTARKYGYCDGTRESKRRWPTWLRKNRTTRSDVFFRSIIEPGSKGHSINIPNLYRIRRIQETIE